MSRVRSLEKVLKPIARTSLSEEIATQIINLISTGSLKPGQRLPPERELCTQFGVGRSSLREALRCLSIVGVLDVRLGEGTFVAAGGEKFIGKVFEWRILTERRDIENLLEVRLALESQTAYGAALRRDDDHVRELGEILNKLRNSLESQKAFASLDLEFHLIIARASKNDLMCDLLAMIRGQLERSLLKVVAIPGGPALALRQHRAVFEAIRDQDAEKAKLYMTDHITSALERYKGTG
jgi:GntR family transcriptional repressor for pyruvate dehydrogenase complex